MTYFEEVEKALEGKDNFHLNQSGAGDVEIRYRDPDGIVLFTTAILPAGVKAAIIDKDFEKTRYRNLGQGAKGDALLAKVKELVPDPSDVSALLDAIETVGKEHLGSN